MMHPSLLHMFSAVHVVQKAGHAETQNQPTINLICHVRVHIFPLAVTKILCNCLIGRYVSLSRAGIA